MLPFMIAAGIVGLAVAHFSEENEKLKKKQKLLIENKKISDNLINHYKEYNDYLKDNLEKSSDKTKEVLNLTDEVIDKWGETIDCNKRLSRALVDKNDKPI